jgi:hypothetical protein
MEVSRKDVEYRKAVVLSPKQQEELMQLLNQSKVITLTPLALTDIFDAYVAHSLESCSEGISFDNKLETSLAFIVEVTLCCIEKAVKDMTGYELTQEQAEAAVKVVLELKGLAPLINATRRANPDIPKYDAPKQNLGYTP